jgi:hypothetical protein
MQLAEKLCPAGCIPRNSPIAAEATRAVKVLKNTIKVLHVCLSRNGQMRVNCVMGFIVMHYRPRARGW